jgi:hypothetical protein
VSAKVTDQAKDRLWTPEEVSSYLGGIPVSTLYQWRYKGIAPRVGVLGAIFATALRMSALGSNSKIELTANMRCCCRACYAC